MRYFKQVGSLILAASTCLLVLGSMNLMAVHPAELARTQFAQMKDPVFNLDFCSNEEWASTTLGEGFPIFTIEGKSLLEREKTDQMLPLRRLAEETTDWYFPILSSGRPVAMLFVTRIKGEWQVSGVGHAGIARELGQFLTVWKPSEGYAFRFIRSFEAKSDFLEIYPGRSLLRNSHSDPLGYLPFLSARVSLELPQQPALQSALLLESQFIEKLAQRVEAGLIDPFKRTIPEPENKER